MSQPVLIAVEPWLIGSRTVSTVSLHDICTYIGVREDAPIFLARCRRKVLLREGHDYVPGRLVSRTAGHFHDARLTIPAARTVLSTVRGIKPLSLSRDLVAWEQAVAAEGVVSKNETPFVGHLFGYKAPADHRSIRLSIAGADVRQDADGRFCLNDCHKASGGEKKDEPSEWLSNAKTVALINEMQGSPGFPGHPVRKVTTGPNDQRGTYVAKELVYAYAMWISPAFHLTVIRAFDAMVHHGETLHAQPAPTSDQQAWAAWLALPLAERRCRQRDITIIGRTHGVEGMRHAMKYVGLPAPPTYTADASGQFEMPFRQIGAVRTISDPPEGSA